MSEPKPIGQIIAEMAADCNNPVGRTLAKCPCVQALLLRQGKTSLEDLSDEEVENLMRQSFLDDWIDNQDVMLMLHISLRSLQTLRSNGTLPYSRINNKIYYLRRDVEKLLNDNYTIRKNAQGHDDKD